MAFEEADYFFVAFLATYPHYTEKYLENKKELAQRPKPPLICEALGDIIEVSEASFKKNESCLCTGRPYNRIKSPAASNHLARCSQE